MVEKEVFRLQVACNQTSYVHGFDNPCDLHRFAAEELSADSAWVADQPLVEVALHQSANFGNEGGMRRQGTEPAGDIDILKQQGFKSSVRLWLPERAALTPIDSKHNVVEVAAGAR